MEIVREKYQTKVSGKCIDREDILLLWNFGFSKEKIAKKLKRDNKTDTQTALKIVEQILYEEVINDNNKRR